MDDIIKQYLDFLHNNKDKWLIIEGEYYDTVGFLEDYIIFLENWIYNSYQTGYCSTELREKFMEK